MIIIGIDPGLIHTGWGIIKNEGNDIKYIASGVINTPVTKPLNERLLNIYVNVDNLIKTYKPENFAIEETFVNDNPITSLKLGQARGVAILASATNSIPFFEYKPNVIKKTITGAGKADKGQMLAMVKYIFPTTNITSADEADALSIAFCHSSYAGRNY
ncbi:MAG: crossover junction endodeoxyribonuclease RuvC [Rickettsiales bacterium]|jgi:crossover junction endodeoxyribonuclease RuvC|nr:crossover junction endodeoxyribonuclease RuvC [Rickettsiales bacterium]